MSNLLKIDFDALSSYSLPMSVNQIPHICRITVENISEYDFRDMTVEIASAPEYFSVYTEKIRVLEQTRVFHMDRVALRADDEKLAYLSAPQTAKLTVRITKQGMTYAEETKAVELLPYDFFPSLYSYTEMAAALVTPDQPEVLQLADRIGKRIGRPSGAGLYRMDEREIKNAFGAVYDEIFQLRITFNTNPLKLELRPAQVKLPEELLKGRNGNSVEISLLFASVLEALGLHALLVFQNGQGYAGCFLRNRCFKSAVHDDGSHLFGGDGQPLPDIVVIDPRSVINGTNVSFENSVRMAQKQFDAKGGAVIAVDIKRARLNGIYPIPNRILRDRELCFERPRAPEEADVFQEEGLLKQAKTDPFSEQARKIKKRLCEVSPRNGLVSLPEETVLWLQCGDTSALSRQALSPEGILLSEYLSREREESMPETLGRLQDGVGKRLYLVLGVVNWDNKQRYAPVILMPVTAEYDEENASLRVYAAEDDTKINHCFLEYLKNAFGISVKLTEIVGDGALSGKERIYAELIDSLAEYGDFSLCDIAALTTLDYLSYELSSVIHPEYIKRAELLDRYVRRMPYAPAEEEAGGGEASAVPEYGLPFALNPSQKAAFRGFLKNSYAVATGPSGSGKTQTMLAAAISLLQKGKKVLYVTADNAERGYDLAKRLDACGLRDRYLTFGLDKNKNRLSEDALAKPSSDGFAEKVFAASEGVRTLDGYYHAVHRIREIGFSLYDAISQYERYQSFPYTIPFTNEQIKALTRQDVVAWFDAVSALTKAGYECNEPYQNPLSFIRNKDFSYDLKSEALVLLNGHLSLTEQFIEYQNRLAAYFGIEIPIIRESQTAALVKMLTLAQSGAEQLCHGFFRAGDHMAALKRLESVVEYGISSADIEDRLRENYTEEILSLNAGELILQWRDAGVMFPLRKRAVQGNIKNKLKSCALNPKLVTGEAVLETLYSIARLEEYSAFIRENSKDFSELFGVNVLAPDLKKDRGVWDRLRGQAGILKEYISSIYEIYAREKSMEAVISHQCALFQSPAKVKADLRALFSDFLPQYEAYTASENALMKLLQFDIYQAKERNTELWYYYITKHLNRLIEHMDLLKPWCVWLREREKAVQVGLQNVVNEYETQQISAGDLKNAFLKGFFKAASEYFLSCDKTLNEFSAEAYEQRCKAQCEAIDAVYAAMPDEVAFALETVLPVRGSAAPPLSPENLDKLVQNPRKRKFSDEIWKYLLERKPLIVSVGTSAVNCFTEGVRFDAVFIDDAHLLPYEKAALYLSRAERVLFAADRFGALVDPEESVVEDLEKDKGISAYGLLRELKVREYCLNVNYHDDCYPAQVIGKLFYQDSISAALPPSFDRYGMTMKRVSGFYDRTGSKTNKTEAAAAVQELIRILKESPAHKTVSVGVYTANTEQKLLIERLLYENIHTSRDLVKKLVSDSGEPFYVRSLYDTRNDPRDIILFSTTYAADEDVRFKDLVTRSMGALSSAQWKARLQNILSAAKKQCILITSLDHEALAKVKCVYEPYASMKNLFYYLSADAPNAVKMQNGKQYADNAMIREAVSYLDRLGYKCDVDIGMGDCRIDIAVKKENSAAYLLGIIFDKSAYRGGIDFYSRECLSLGRLEQKGWKLVRILAVEWFENSAKVLAGIKSLLEDSAGAENIALALTPQ